MCSLTYMIIIYNTNLMGMVIESVMFDSLIYPIDAGC